MQDQMGAEPASLEDGFKIPGFQDLERLVLILEFMASGITPGGAVGVDHPASSVGSEPIVKTNKARIAERQRHDAWEVLSSTLRSQPARALSRSTPLQLSYCVNASMLAPIAS
jgi:hypothetical protein